MRNTLKLWLATAITLAVLFSFASSCTDNTNGPIQKSKTTVIEVALLSDLIAYKLENEVVRQKQPLDSAKQAILLKNLAELHQSTRRIELKLEGDTTGITPFVLCRCCECPSTAESDCCWCPKSSEKKDSISIIGAMPDSLITEIEGSLVDSAGTMLLQAANFTIQIDGMEFSGIRFLFSESDFNGEAILKITALVNGEPVEVSLKGTLQGGAWTPGGEQ